MKSNLIGPELLQNIMLECGLEREDVASYTESHVRSVYRWLEYGIPKAKYELLKMRLKIK